MAFLQFRLPEGWSTFRSDQDHLDVEPLDYDDLVAHVSGVEEVVPVVVRGVVETDEEGVPVPGGQRMTASFEWKPRGSMRFYGLVPEGWVPPVFGNGRVAFLDRNIVSRLKTCVPDGSEPEPEPEPEPGSSDSEPEPESESQGDQPEPLAQGPEWIYRVFASGNFEVSPAMYLLEGRNRRTPTRAEMEAELHELVDDLRRRMPDARLHQLGGAELNALYAILQDRQEATASKIAFLREVAPLVHIPAKASDRPAIEERVFTAAARLGVQRTSFVVVAVLSCLYDNPQLPKGDVHRPGRAVLKPKPQYSERQAYNAVADLDALELLVNANALLRDYRGVYFTADLGLVAFWTALEPRNAVVEDTRPGMARATLTMTLTDALVPSLNEDEREALAQRLRG